MRKGKVRCRNTIMQAKGDGDMQCTMSPGCCSQDKGDKGSPQTIMNVQCTQATIDAASPRRRHLKNMQATSNAASPRLTLPYKCEQAKKDVVRSYPTSEDECV